jgi:cellulose synthase/poly-beta-1,6-N-acetylglucosamine synthase-like glycosyltransferase
MRENQRICISIIIPVYKVEAYIERCIKSVATQEGIGLAYNLECILVDATKNTIKLTANDMELGIETVIEGEVIEKGTHQSLLRQKGYYHKLYLLQFKND